MDYTSSYSLLNFFSKPNVKGYKELKTPASERGNNPTEPLLKSTSYLQ